MDETNAPRVRTQPAEVVERGTPRPRQALQISLCLTTISSAKHICALLIEVLAQRGHRVDLLEVRKHEPLAGYDRASALKT